MGYVYTKSGKLAKRLYFGAVLLFEGLYYTFKNRVLADGGTFVENELPTISQDAKLVLTPNAYKAGKLYSAVPNDGTGDFTVVRNSTATYIDEDGLIKTALANVPRIDYGTGEAALLVEPQSTNLSLWSEDCDSTYWRKNNGATVTINQIISPDGTLNADRVTFPVDGQISTRLSFTGTADLYQSYYVKKGTCNIVRLREAYYFGNAILFDLNDGSIVEGATQGGIEALANDWFKIWIKNTYSSQQEISYILESTQVGNLHVWGSKTATEYSSYIKTEATSVTRLADNISVPTPAGVTSITETIGGIEQTPITTIPATYSLPVGNINKVKMQ